ncbi:MAG TPA: OB-fold domain-containing protein [Candidatus Limnocylindria bacterium]|nr:OB-fold domain-containing protein [Candidatus Limnocylindria bacterium]
MAAYVRATDPFPLESAEHTRLHEFYTRLATGRLATTQCSGCGATAWPPRGFCPDCTSDQFEWIDLPTEGTVHGFTVQETGLPSGFDAPRVFAIITVGAHRIFSVVTGADPTTLAIGTRVRLAPMKIANGPKDEPRWLPAFTLA